MKASELIKFLGNCIERVGDQEIELQVEFTGKRSQQKLFDIWCSDEQIVLASKEAVENDPLLSLPTLSIVPDGGFSEPQ